MKFLKSLFDFYINASIHVAVAVYALVRITERYFALPYNVNMDALIFYATISGYNFIKYASIAKLRHKSLTPRLRGIQAFSLFCFVLACYYGFQMSLKTILFFIPLGILTFFYTTPFLNGFTKNLRSISSIKIVIIALVWAATTVILPLLDVQKTINLSIFCAFLQRFLLVIILTIPFDIRDFKLDDSNLKTLPQLIGIANTKKIAYIFLYFSLLLELYFSADFYTKNIFLVICFLLMFMLVKSSSRQSKYYSSFWVEAVPIFWWGLLYSLS